MSDINEKRRLFHEDVLLSNALKDSLGSARSGRIRTASSTTASGTRSGQNCGTSASSIQGRTWTTRRTSGASGNLRQG